MDEFRTFFIVQPTKGKSSVYLDALREMAIDALRRQFCSDPSVCSPIFTATYEEHMPIRALSERIQYMDQADMVVFLPGSKEDDTCRCQRYIAMRFGKVIADYNMIKDEVVLWENKQ